MSENSFKSIRNGAMASILAGVALAFIPELRSYGVVVLERCWSLVLWCWIALIDTYALPGWLWIPIMLLTLMGVSSIYQSLKVSKKQPEYIKYQEDFLYSVKWRWTWHDNKISNLWCFCPSCDATLVYDDSSCRSFYEESKTDFICENCHNRIVTTVKGGDHYYAIEAAEREILRRIRTGEYNAH
ncbi:hypothetical protein ACTIRA_004597 [Vibrio parahaemolyticus]